MPRTLILPRLIALAASVGLHLLLLAAALWLQVHAPLPTAVTPVEIVNLPREALRRLPPLSRPEPAPPVPRGMPEPKRFGAAPEVALPRTAPSPVLPDAEAKGGPDAGRPAEQIKRGPLPFLTQAEIDELAKKGMPARKPGDDSVTLDTDEFKFISYNRWLKVKVESILRYPELAAVSGIQGTLYIRFDIMKDGTLGDLELLKSSGYKILDDEALRAIRASAPFAALPDEWQMERYPIRAAVLFYLNAAYIR